MTSDATRADPCPEIPGDVRTWNGFDAFDLQIRLEWPEAVPKIISTDPMTWEYHNTPDGQMVGYV